MHILLVADGRSPITSRWICGLQKLNHRVTLVSTFPCKPMEGVEETIILPAAFSGLAGSQAGLKTRGETSSQTQQLVRQFRGIFLSVRYFLGPFTLSYYGRKLQKLIERTKPDLVHALRIPFEGMLASYAPPKIPLVVSIWGNDLTLHARGSRTMGKLTRRTLQRADGLIADTERDLRLGGRWSFPSDRPSLCVPGGGGVDLAEIHRTQTLETEHTLPFDFPANMPLVVNPRGFRPGSVRNDVFFESIPLILERQPQVFFACPAMAGQEEAQKWVQLYHLEEKVGLLPYLTQGQLWNLFKQAAVSISISEHDGTPNSLLEAMACGCLPIAGDIESLREWIVPGVNGLLVEPNKPQALAEAVLLALSQPNLRSSAAEVNLRILAARAETSLVMAQIEVFFQRLV
ncbi:MAG: glycosyltransferase [Anaerolineaceae bacterium]